MGRSVTSFYSSLSSISSNKYSTTEQIHPPLSSPRHARRTEARAKEFTGDPAGTPEDGIGRGAAAHGQASRRTGDAARLHKPFMRESAC